MFTISDQAFKSFTRPAEERFVTRLADFLIQSVPEMADVPRETHLAMTRQVFQRAWNLGFSTEEDVARYAVCAALLGPDFADHFPGAQEILELNEPASYRARLLEYFTCELFDKMDG